MIAFIPTIYQALTFMSYIRQRYTEMRFFPILVPVDTAPLIKNTIISQMNLEVNFVINQLIIHVQA